MSYLSPVICITDVHKVFGFKVCWRSWAWQVQRFPAVVQALPPAVRAFRAGDVAPMLEIAAREGWWQLGRGVMDKLAKHLSVDIEPGSDIFGVLWGCAKRVLQCTDDETLEFLAHRLSALKRRGKFSDELLSIDGAIVCLDDGDQGEIRREQENSKDRKKEEENFRHNYRERKTAVRASGAKSQAQKKALNKVPWKGPRQLPPSSQEIEQRDAKAFMPCGAPSSYLWRANRQGAWYSKVGSMPACSRSDAAHGGSYISLRLVIQDAWANWLTVQGYPMSACPIEGMWEVWDPRQAAPSGQSASSSGGP